MAKRQSKYLLMNYENITYERAAARYVFISYIFSKNILPRIYRSSNTILGLISIGLTIGIITAVLLYFFVRDLKVVNRNSLNIKRNEDMPSSDYIYPDDSEYQQRESQTFEHDGIDEQ